MQPRFKYSGCGPFTESKEGIQKFKETGDLRYIYQNRLLDKACFQFNIAKNPNVMDINANLLQ